MDLLSVHEALGTGEVDRQLGIRLADSGVPSDAGSGVFVDFRNKCRVDILYLIPVIKNDIAASSNENEVLVRYVKSVSVDHHDGESVKGQRMHEFAEAGYDGVLHALKWAGI